jgi:hypothetical protein
MAVFRGSVPSKLENRSAHSAAIDGFLINCLFLNQRLTVDAAPTMLRRTD